MLEQELSHLSAVPRRRCYTGGICRVCTEDGAQAAQAGCDGCLGFSLCTSCPSGCCVWGLQGVQTLPHSLQEQQAGQLGSGTELQSGVLALRMLATGQEDLSQDHASL